MLKKNVQRMNHRIFLVSSHKNIIALMMKRKKRDSPFFALSLERAQGLITLSPDDFSSTIRFVAMGQGYPGQEGGRVSRVQMASRCAW